MKNTKLLLCLLLPFSLMISACSETASSSTEDNTYPIYSDESSSSSESEKDGGDTSPITPEEELTLLAIQDIMFDSRPTQISTRQVYTNPSIGTPLNFTMNVTIEYGAIIEALYTYSYEKLAPSTSDSFTELVTGQYYAQGTSLAEIVDGDINWISPMEKTLNLPNIVINDVNSYTSHDIGTNYANLSIKDDCIDSVLGAHYDISDVSLRIVVDRAARTLKELDIYYTTDSDATVRSVTTYGYEPKEININ